MKAEIVLRKTKAEHQSTQKFKMNYQSMLGSIMYIMLQTQPDIVYIILKLSQFSSNLTEQHLQTLKHVLHYLKGTTNLGLTYQKKKKEKLID